MARPGLQMIAAFGVAPVAGSVAVFLAGVQWSFAFMGHGKIPQPLEVIAASAIIAAVSIFFCMFYTVLVGGVIAGYMFVTKKTPHAAIVIIGGAMAGFLPVVFSTAHLFHAKTLARFLEELYVPVLTLAGAFADAGTFWLLGVRSNAPRQSEL